MDLTPPQSEVAAPLHLIALAAACAAEAEVPAGPEAAWIDAQRAKVELSGSNFVQQVAHWRTARVADARLIDLAEAWQLSPVEAIAVALACAAETDAMVGRVLAWLQAPVGRARPTLGLIATIAARLGETSAFATLAGGPARASGLLQFDGDGRVLPETGLSVPLPIVFALVDPATAPAPSGVRIGLNEAPPLPPSVRSAAHVRAHALSSGGGLVVRSGHPREARAVAAEIAGALGACAAFIEGDAPPGLGPWLTLSGCLPVLCAELAPGEKRPVPLLRGWNGPWLVASGLDGNFERECEALPAWRIPVPPAAERIALWHTSLGDSELARTLGSRHRHAAVRIAELARAGRYQARLDGSDTITANAVCAAARAGATTDLGMLAELAPEPICDDALVLPSATRNDLESLALRCVTRDALADRLGPAARARYRPGVRALLVGPSGTGKTLAAGWLATRLGLPLYRVDLASVTSKYIGETEKNLAQLFARAEHAEVVLLFDEADSLFGKRTDVKEANDRFANAQTNYLLSRIESYEGIALLTSNSRARFDSGFTRRLDAIIDFPLPGPEERRALWLAHLGSAHTLDAGALNRLAANCELAGGHIRNMVLAAAASARGAARPIVEDDLLASIAAEYRKLGKPAPAALSAGAYP